MTETNPTIDTRETKLNEKNLRIAIVAVLLLIAPMTLIGRVTMPYFGVIHTLWIGFAFSCLTVLSGIVVAASLRAMHESVFALRDGVERLKGVKTRKTAGTTGVDQGREVPMAA